MRTLFAFLFCLAFVMVVPMQSSAGPPGHETTIYTIDQNFDVPAISFISTGEWTQPQTFRAYNEPLYKPYVPGTVRTQDKTLINWNSAYIITPTYNIESNYGEVVYAYSMARLCVGQSFAYIIYLKDQDEIQPVPYCYRCQVDFNSYLSKAPFLRTSRGFFMARWRKWNTAVD